MKRIIEIRRVLHSNPELSFKEHETTKILLNEVQRLSKDLIIHRPLDTGLVVEYRVNDGPFVILRGDIDALPIEENTGCEFSSKNKNTHACGHDVHTAALLGALFYTVENKIDFNVLFVFQPGEEAGGGALKMLDTGFFESFPIAGAFAFHVTDEFPLGAIASCPDVLFASALEVNMLFEGKSAHVAFPEKGIDALKGVNHLLNFVYSGRLKERGLIFGIGKGGGGRVRNIIADQGFLEGSLRSKSLDRSYEYLDELKKYAVSELKKETGVKVDIQTGSVYREVRNDEELFHHCKAFLKGPFHFYDIDLRMTGEDFGYFSQKYPSFMFWLGTREKGIPEYGLHNPAFLPSDKSLLRGIQAWTEIIDHLKDVFLK